MKLLSIYSVPIWQSDYPEFEETQELLLKVIKEYKEKNETKEVPTSNIFGYQSPNTLHYEEELRPLFEYLCQLAYKACSDLDFVECDIALTSAWLNVNDTRQCMNSEHVHGDTFSGVFYLKVPEGSGKLSVRNISINPIWKGLDLVSDKNQFTAETVKIEPTEGNIILFPSYLPHFVEPNDHDDERISISFNIIALPKGSINQQ